VRFGGVEGTSVLSVQRCVKAGAMAARPARPPCPQIGHCSQLSDPAAFPAIGKTLHTGKTLTGRSELPSCVKLS